jgi:syndecan 2
MLHSARLLLVLLAAHYAVAEYTWTGSEWEWQNPEDGQLPSQGGAQSGGVQEGSGGFDDEDDDEDYNYDDEEEDFPMYTEPKRPAKTFGQSKKTPPRTQIFDDEDLSEGSGPDSGTFGGHDGGHDDEDDLEEGSGYDEVVAPTWQVTQPPPRRQEPPRQVVPKVTEEEEEDLYVDSVNYNGSPDVFFGEGNNKEDNNRNRVTTTESTKPKPTEAPHVPSRPTNHRPVSFFAQPGILAAVIGGAVVGLLCAILLVMFIVYRMRKKDEGSYALDEPKRAHNANSYSKPPSREFYA